MPRARTLEERIDAIRPEHATRASTLGDRTRGPWRFWGALPVVAIALLLVLRALLHTDPIDQLAPAPSDPRDPPGTTAYEGAVAITRGGPVKLGYQSDGPVRLVFTGRDLIPPDPLSHLRVGQPVPLGGVHENLQDAVLHRGRTAVARIFLKSHFSTTIVTPSADRKTIAALAVELSGPGLQVERAVMLHGVATIHFAVAGNARLVWSPVGRRGDPEYVPASSLASSPTADFDSPGTSRLDGAIALAILLIVIATLCVLARRRLATVSRHTLLAMTGVLVAGLVARLVGLGDQGETWDEGVNWASGRNYVTNLLALDFSARSWEWNFEHPPVMKYLAGIGSQFSDGYGPARALSALWSALGCALLVPIGARLYRVRVGVLAGAIAALVPPLVAHGQVVGHEAPTILWWSLGILLSLRVHDYLPTDDRRAKRALLIRLVWIGVVVGVAIASRFVNGLLGPLCALIVVAQAPARWRIPTIGWGALLMPLAAIVTLYTLWPRLWFHPLANLGAAFAKLDTKHSHEPFLGAMTNQPGPGYFAIYLVSTIPIGVLAGLILWLVRSGLELRAKNWRTPVLVFAWLAIPLLGIMISPVRQDGVRYVMPCVLVFAVMAAAGVDGVATRLERFHRRIFHGIAGVLVAYLVTVDVRTAPYYLDYFGEQVGSTGEIARARMLETAWWGEGLDRAVDYVNEHAEPNAIVIRCIDPAHLAWFREDLWSPPRPADVTWVVHYAPLTRGCPLPPKAREVYEVTHDGVTLARVYRAVRDGR